MCNIFLKLCVAKFKKGKFSIKEGVESHYMFSSEFIQAITFLQHNRKRKQ